MVRQMMQKRVDGLFSRLSALALKTAEREYNLMDETSPVKLSKKGVMPEEDMLELMSIKFELMILEGALDG